MANIQTYLQRIKSAIYGREVRDSIHDAIDAINDEVIEAHDEIDDFVQGEMDTTLTSTTLPAQGKAVGDAIANIQIDVDDTLSETGEAADAKAVGDAIDDVVIASGTQPTSEFNQIWIDDEAEDEYTVPTYSEFSEVKDVLTYSGIITSFSTEEISTGKINPSSGEVGSSSVAVTVNGTNYIVYATRSSAYLDKKYDALQTNKADYYMTLFGYDGENSDSYAGAFNKSNSTFTTEFPNTRDPYVYTDFDLAAVRELFPNYKLKIMIVDISIDTQLTVENAISAVDVIRNISEQIEDIDNRITSTENTCEQIQSDLVALGNTLDDIEDEFNELKENHGFTLTNVLNLAFVRGSISDTKGTDAGSSNAIRTDNYYDVSDTNILHVTFDDLTYPTLLFCTFLYSSDGTYLSIVYKHQGTYDIDVSAAGKVRFKVQRESSDLETVVDPSDGIRMVDARYTTYTILATEDDVESALSEAKAYTDAKTTISEQVKLVWQTGKVSDSTGQDSQSSNTSYIRNSFSTSFPKAKINYSIPSGINVDMFVYTGEDFSTFSRVVTGLNGTGSETVTLGQYVRFVANYTSLSAIDPEIGDAIIFGCDADFQEIVSDIEKNRIESYFAFSMFSDFGVCGDSFASGAIFPNGTGITDYEISWPQILARKCGATCYNYSVGGISTKDWLANNSRGLSKLMSDPAKKMYICNFGINDNTQINAGTFTLGTVDDIKEDYTQNPESFFGCYGRIIGNIHTHAPSAPIILLSIARPTERNMDVSIQAIAEKCGLPYIQLTDDAYFDSGYFLGSFNSNHPLAYGYAGMANAIERLICKYIVEHPAYFKLYS